MAYTHNGTKTWGHTGTWSNKNELVFMRLILQHVLYNEDLLLYCTSCMWTMYYLLCVFHSGAAQRLFTQTGVLQQDSTTYHYVSLTSQSQTTCLCQLQPQLVGDHSNVWCSWANCSVWETKRIAIKETKQAGLYVVFTCRHIIKIIIAPLSVIVHKMYGLL